MKNVQCKQGTITINTSGVISVGGLSVGLATCGVSSGNFPLPNCNFFASSGSAGVSSFYNCVFHILFVWAFRFNRFCVHLQ